MTTTVIQNESRVTVFVNGHVVSIETDSRRSAIKLHSILSDCEIEAVTRKPSFTQLARRSAETGN